jgi:PadR family transcriptional regulator AphA
MMRQGAWAYWFSSQSQYYAEPKRLERAGYLTATRTPGRTHDRTHYTLTDAGRAALREWLAEPSAFTRIQCEPIVRLLAAEYVDPEVLEHSLAALRQPLAESYAALDSAEALARELPHRERVLLINHRLARRILDAHAAWLDEAEAELRVAAGRRR